jgi:PhnB protein
MVQNPPDGYPSVSPYLFYEDVAASLDWLGKAFGFVERMRMPGPGGDIAHAEMELNGGVVMMGCPSSDYENPARHGHAHQLIHVYVDDVDAHCERARSAGARIVAEPEDKPYGDRSYTAADPEGHQWSFAEHIRDVSLEEMEAG